MADCYILSSRLAGFFLCLSLLFCCSKALNKRDPTDNVNLTPFAQWLSAYYCLKNVSVACVPQYTLNASGWLNVSAVDTQEFCEPRGCGEHTKHVLQCIRYVKPDYWFMNNATIKDINNTINVGCAQGFNGTSFYPSDGYNTKATISIKTTFFALTFLSVFYV